MVWPDITEVKTVICSVLISLTVIFLIPQYAEAVTITALPRSGDFESIKIDLTIDGYEGGKVNWTAHRSDSSIITGSIDELEGGKATHEIPGRFPENNGLWLIEYSYGNTNKTISFVANSPAYSESEKEILSLLKKGIEFSEQSNFTQAISYYDKVLKIDPKNIHALNNKGNAMVKMGKAFDAIAYFNKALETEPHSRITNQNLLNAQIHLDYYPIPGFFEVQVRDSDGRLVAFFSDYGDLRVLNNTQAKNFIKRWSTEKNITRNGVEMEITQLRTELDVGRSAVFGQTYIEMPDYDRMAIAFGVNWGYPVQKGDTVSSIFTLFKPVT